MKTTIAITSRGVITLPVELYSPAREQEFDAAESKLASFLRRKVQSAGRSARTRAGKSRR